MFKFYLFSLVVFYYIFQTNATLSVGPPAGSLYLGCWNDHSFMPIISTSTTMTLASCAASALALGYRFMGAGQGKYCYASYTPTWAQASSQSVYALPEYTCGTLCPGTPVNGTQYGCGNPSFGSISVWDMNPKAQILPLFGCFATPSPIPDVYAPANNNPTAAPPNSVGVTNIFVPYATFQSAQLMTPQLCVDLALSQNSLASPFAGIVNNTCYGLTSANYVSSFSCSIPCSGDTSSMCGGTGAMTVYKTSTNSTGPPTGSLYMGCWNSHAYMTQLFTSTTLTLASCAFAALASGYRFMAAYGTNICFASNAQSWAARSNQDAQYQFPESPFCSSLCPGTNGGDPYGCGYPGAGTLTVWDMNPFTQVYSSTGCFATPSTLPPAYPPPGSSGASVSPNSYGMTYVYIPTAPYQVSQLMTPQLCVELALTQRALASPYAAIYNGTCYGLANIAFTSSTTCTSPCSGDSSSSCGGVAAMSVYQTTGTIQPPSSSPTTAYPTTLLPTTIIPTTAVPSTVIPSTANPTTAIPSTAIPTTIIPSTAIPTTIHPSTAVPTTVVPTTAIPTTVKPTTAVPTTVIPTTAIRTTVAPSTAIPSTALPTTVVPSTVPPTVK